MEGSFRQCEQHLKHNDPNESDDNITNLDDIPADNVSGECDTQSHCIMCKPSSITNFDVYTTARKRSIVKSCKYAIESVKSLKVKFEQYISRMPS